MIERNYAKRPILQTVQANDNIAKIPDDGIAWQGKEQTRQKGPNGYQQLDGLLLIPVCLWYS